MNRLIPILLLTIAVVSPVKSQNLDYAREVIDSLCSEYMHGRGYVRDGHLRAANYLVREYKKHGLKYFGNGYMQGFPIKVNTFPGKVLLMMGDKRLTPGVDFLVDPCAPFAAGDFDVVYIKKKQAINIKKMVKLYAGKKLEGKVLVFDKTEIDQKNKDEKDRFDAAISLLKHTTGVGPAAAVILTDEKLTWYVAGYSCSVPVFMVNKEMVSDQVDFISLEVESVLANEQITQNVIGYIEGAVQPDSFLVFSAHYDHLGRMGSRAWFPGANDDASGNAMMLNLAEHFAKPENRPDYSIAFMAFGGEEAGILGSEFFVEHTMIPLDHIKFMINMDIVGTGDEGITVVNGSVFPDFFDRLTAINSEKDYLVKIKKRGKARNSDHYYFTEKNVPAFFIYTMGGTSAYHDIYDTPDQLPLAEFEDLFRLIVDFVNSF